VQPYGTKDGANPQPNMTGPSDAKKASIRRDRKAARREGKKQTEIARCPDCGEVLQKGTPCCS
jgi:hypothetical protein